MDDSFNGLEAPVRATSLWWIRRDLRIEDNANLARALGHARKLGSRVAALFVLDDHLLAPLDRDDRRVHAILQGLAEIDTRLRDLGGGLHVLRGDPREAVPSFALTHRIQCVFAGGDAEPYGRSRDATIQERLGELGCTLELGHDHMVVAPGQVHKADGSDYRVFTPFHRAWLSRIEAHPESIGEVVSTPACGEIFPAMRAWDLDALADLAGFVAPATPAWPGGESAARRRLAAFMGRIEHYASARDYPGLDGSSRLSMDLRLGFLSAREAAREAIGQGGASAAKWLSELAWRDFYQEILRLHPRTVKEPFQERLGKVVWDDPDSDDLAAQRWRAWTEGRTGYPFVDAAMRELAATGWMHNRARMVVASFLCKDLHIHWKRGERWFARHLVDIELASNVGGWQWSAGTGTDAQPWFRVFHPVEQSRRWDPEGRWIRRWCPELSSLPPRWIHEPWRADPTTLAKAGIVIGLHWPAPIVDHAWERKETLERFARIARA